MPKEQTQVHWTVAFDDDFLPEFRQFPKPFGVRSIC